MVHALKSFYCKIKISASDMNVPFSLRNLNICNQFNLLDKNISSVNYTWPKITVFDRKHICTNLFKMKHDLWIILVI